MVVTADYLFKYVFRKNHLWEKKKNRIGSLESHLVILDDEFEELIDVGKLSKVRSWYKNMGLRVKTHRYHSIPRFILTSHSLLCNR